ncbi:MAG: hypothetical protein BM564_09875 [Bacteroidetes bacterium MedPE-SWsnd-G2]|nr:MAG: hypothetical protein BM564_09875 [Bacteroidetes bacterium MedPE-SWsnd-G2]
MTKNTMLCLFFICAFSICTFAQERGAKDKDAIEFVPTPYATHNDITGTAVGVIPMILYRISKKDTISPKSTSGLGAMYTTNKSFSMVAFSQLYFNQNKWRAKVFFGAGNINFQTYLDDESHAPDFYDYTTEVLFFQFQGNRKIYKSIYGGLGFTHINQKAVFDDINRESETVNNAIVLNLQSDSRDDVHYPKKGHYINMDYLSFPDWIENTDESHKFKIYLNKYIAKRETKDVLAFRFAAKFGLGNINFNQQVVLGRLDLRGYSEGKFRGDGLFATQAEYRWNFKEKMGVVGFAGLGTIYGSPTESFDWKLYPSVGMGIRVNMFKFTPLNVGLDGAVGKEDWGIYFRIGESF